MSRRELEAGLAQELAELGGLDGINRLRRPLIGVFGEELNRRAADANGFEKRILHAAGDRRVSTQWRAGHFAPAGK